MYGFMIIVLTYLIVALISAFFGAKINTYRNKKKCTECLTDLAKKLKEYKEFKKFKLNNKKRSHIRWLLYKM
jgi:hypothetical protein